MIHLHGALPTQEDPLCESEKGFPLGQMLHPKLEGDISYILAPLVPSPGLLGNSQAESSVSDP